MQIKELKKLSKEEFLKLEGATEELYNALQSSKEGNIKIWKEDDPSFTPQFGFTYAFGEGISVNMSNFKYWYRTSVIQNINWEEGYFDTLNSRYNFTFEEYDAERENSDSNESCNEN